MTSKQLGRVKVAVRCRPPFEDEVVVDGFRPVVNITEEGANDGHTSAAMVQLDLSASRKRDFYFDHAFDPSSTQDHVYNTIARPVVDGVLNGFNGTIFAYGQTGTGKTYTMGILNQLRGQSTAGIVPRAVEHIFESERELPSGSVTVSMSFLQIYNNSIQDLISDSAQMESNLPLREDPRKGFYVEGLSNFAVATYEEAQELVNFGLENRAIAPTLMNTTSSRSHTVLTVHVEKREAADAGSDGVSRTLRGKLLLVDLAGSERVRRTTSKGARLSEAKAINTSLSVLGNVIAALAEPGTTHIPFRDSKLTRLLQDSLGGTASTALIATVGPAPINRSESLSTLLFASRCMHVKSNPVQHEEVDFAELCTRMQAQMADMEKTFYQRELEQQERYEAVIAELVSQVRDLKAEVQKSSSSPAVSAGTLVQDIEHALSSLGDISDSASNGWLNPNPPSPSDVALATIFTAFVDLVMDGQEVTRHNRLREEERARSVEEDLASTEDRMQLRLVELEGMAAADPIKGTEMAKHLGPHLAPMDMREAQQQADSQFPSNNFGAEDFVVQTSQSTLPKRELYSLESLPALLQYISELKVSMSKNNAAFDNLMQAKDKHFNELKKELVVQTKERRHRQEEVLNWSYVLRYLLKTNSTLRQQIQEGVTSSDSVLQQPGRSIAMPGGGSEADIFEEEDQLSPRSIQKLLPTQESTDALIQKVNTLTEHEIAQMPQEQRNAILQLKQELGAMQSQHSSTPSSSWLEGAGGYPPSQTGGNQHQRHLQSAQRRQIVSPSGDDDYFDTEDD